MLDIVFRIERRHGVRLESSDFSHLWKTGQTDTTAGDLYEILCITLHQSGKAVPPSCWNGLRLDLANALGVSPLIIRRESKLIADLGMS